MKFLDYPLIKTKEDHDSKVWYFDISGEEGQDTKLVYKAMRIDLYYSKGGYGGFDWTLRPRGYYVALKPCTISTRPAGYQVEESTLLGEHSGGYIFLEETKRFNRKRLETIESLAQEKVDAYAAKVVDSLKVAS